MNRWTVDPIHTDVQFKVKHLMINTVTGEFTDFDAKVEPHLKKHYDHGLMINRHDPLLKYLQAYIQDSGDALKLNIFERPTSVENLAHKLFSEITELGFRLSSIEIRETDTSVIQYTRSDWVEDNRHFAGHLRKEVDV